MKPELPARKTSRRFIPNPSPTTLDCSSVFESDLVRLAYGFEKPSPNPNPSASAMGGDFKITVNNNSKQKTSLESIRTSICAAFQANNRIHKTYRTRESYKFHKSYSFLNQPSTQV